MESIDMHEKTGNPNKAGFYLHYASLLETVVQERIRYSLVDLLSQLGGTLGLLTGCSVLSIIEVVLVLTFYFVHLLSNMLIKRREDVPT